jgi:hypothetical protein
LDKTKNGLAFVLPLYGSFDYGRKAALSFFARTPVELNPVLLTFDDASPGSEKEDWNAWYEGLPRERCFHRRYPANGGLTRSWNHGLGVAHDLQCRYAIAGNSDVLFTPFWSDGLRYVLDQGLAKLVGPVTNAPGRTEQNRQKQNVRNFYPDYSMHEDVDSAEELLKVSTFLKDRYAPPGVVERDINGFFMMAKVEDWWDGRFDKHHVFNPANKMVGNEDELVMRWKKRGTTVGFVPASYIFHYRSVSRVVKGVDVGRHRPKNLNKEF